MIVWVGWLIFGAWKWVFSDLVFEAIVWVYRDPIGGLWWVWDCDLVVGFEECGNVGVFDLSSVCVSEF